MRTLFFSKKGASREPASATNAARPQPARRAGNSPSSAPSATTAIVACIGKCRGSGRAANAGAAAKKAVQMDNSKKRCAGDASSGKNKLAKMGGGRHGAGGGAGHRGGGGGSGCALSMSLGDTGGDDDALPPLEELSGADASPGNGAGARGYDFDREDRRRGVRGARHDEVPVLRLYIDNPCRTADTMLFVRDAFSTPNGVQP